MKTKKMSLANIQGKLSRTEMKNIMAGSGSGCGGSCDYGSTKGTCKVASNGGCYCSSGMGQCSG